LNKNRAFFTVFTKYPQATKWKSTGCLWIKKQIILFDNKYVIENKEKYTFFVKE
jgi:hypothetical protein